MSQIRYGKAVVDSPGPDSLPFEVDSSETDTAVMSQWLEISRAVSAAVPLQDAEMWLGGMVVEVQKASDRSIAAAQAHAEALVAEARGEAISIRESGRRRAQAIARLKIAMQTGERAGPRSGMRSVDREITPTVADEKAPTAFAAAATDRPSGPWWASMPDLWAPGPSPAPPTPHPAGADRLVRPPAPRRIPSGEAAKPTDPRDYRRSGQAECGTGRYQSATPTGGAAERAVATTPPSPGAEPAVRTRSLRVQPKAVLVIVAVLAAVLGLPLFEHYATAAREHRAQYRLGEQLANLEALPASRRPVAGMVFGSMDVPRLRISRLNVVEGATLSDLREGPAHVASSQIPGQSGAIVVLGHRSTYGAPFAGLASLRLGDVISLRTPAGLYVYRVSVGPEVLRPGSGSVQLPSSAAVQASGGTTTGAEQSLILATSASSRLNSASMLAVVASLDQASALAVAPSTTAGKVVAQFGFVPGETAGLLFLGLWLLVIAGVIEGGRLLSKAAPLALILSAQLAVGVICVFQIYQAVDRIVPGTH